MLSLCLVMSIFSFSIADFARVGVELYDEETGEFKNAPAWKRYLLAGSAATIGTGLVVAGVWAPTRCATRNIVVLKSVRSLLTAQERCQDHSAPYGQLGRFSRSFPARFARDFVQPAVADFAKVAAPTTEERPAVQDPPTRTTFGLSQIVPPSVAASGCGRDEDRSALFLQIPLPQAPTSPAD